MRVYLNRFSLVCGCVCVCADDDEADNSVIEEATKQHQEQKEGAGAVDGAGAGAGKLRGCLCVICVCVCVCVCACVDCALGVCVCLCVYRRKAGTCTCTCPCPTIVLAGPPLSPPAGLVGGDSGVSFTDTATERTYTLLWNLPVVHLSTAFEKKSCCGDFLPSVFLNASIQQNKKNKMHGVKI